MSFSSNHYLFIKQILYLFIDETVDELPVYVRSILAFIAALFVSLPLNFKAIIDILVIMHANFIEWDSNLVPGDVRVNNFSSVRALARVKHLFLSKSAMMTLNMRKAKVLQIKGRWYFD
jgi:hypothetical protein